jgi:hypothetical protein
MMAAEEECTRAKTQRDERAAAAAENMEGMECLALKRITLGRGEVMNEARVASSSRVTSGGGAEDMVKDARIAACSSEYHLNCGGAAGGGQAPQRR